MARKFTAKDRQYWGQALIALSQVTFGVAWASMFVPVDLFRVLLVTFNIVTTVVFLIVGWRFFRRT